jgi:hypothetical protein
MNQTNLANALLVAKFYGTLDVNELSLLNALIAVGDFTSPYLAKFADDPVAVGVVNSLFVKLASAPTLTKPAAK